MWGGYLVINKRSNHFDLLTSTRAAPQLLAIKGLLIYPISPLLLLCLVDIATTINIIFNIKYEVQIVDSDTSFKETNEKFQNIVYPLCLYSDRIFLFYFMLLFLCLDPEEFEDDSEYEIYDEGLVDIEYYRGMASWFVIDEFIADKNEIPGKEKMPCSTFTFTLVTPYNPNPLPLQPEYPLYSNNFTEIIP